MLCNTSLLNITLQKRASNAVYGSGYVTNGNDNFNNDVNIQTIIFYKIEQELFTRLSRKRTLNIYLMKI